MKPEFILITIDNNMQVLININNINSIYFLPKAALGIGVGNDTYKIDDSDYASSLFDALRRKLNVLNLTKDAINKMGIQPDI